MLLVPDAWGLYLQYTYAYFLDIERHVYVLRCRCYCTPVLWKYETNKVEINTHFPVTGIEYHQYKKINFFYSCTPLRSHNVRLLERIAPRRCPSPCDGFISDFPFELWLLILGVQDIWIIVITDQIYMGTQISTVPQFTQFQKGLLMCYTHVSIMLPTLHNCRF